MVWKLGHSLSVRQQLQGKKVWSNFRFVIGSDRSLQRQGRSTGGNRSSVIETPRGSLVSGTNVLLDSWLRMRMDRTDRGSVVCSSSLSRLNGGFVDVDVFPRIIKIWCNMINEELSSEFITPSLRTTIVVWNHFRFSFISKIFLFPLSFDNIQIFYLNIQIYSPNILTYFSKYSSLFYIYIYIDFNLKIFRYFIWIFKFILRIFWLISKIFQPFLIYIFILIWKNSDFWQNLDFNFTVSILFIKNNDLCIKEWFLYPCFGDEGSVLFVTRHTSSGLPAFLLNLYPSLINLQVTIATRLRCLQAHLNLVNLQLGT